MKKDNKSEDAIFRQKTEEIPKSTDGVSEFAENIINTVREPLLALDQDLRVVKASRSFYNLFKVTDGETIGKLIYDLGDNQWNIPKLRELLETILPEKTTFDDYEVEHDFSTIGKRVMLLNARQIKRAFGKEKIILLAIEDITERKLAEKSLSEKSRTTSEYLDILLDHAHTPIIIWDSSMVIKRFNHEFEKLSGYDSTEVIDQKIDILFPKDKIDSILELLNNHLNDENMEVIEIDILTKDQKLKTVLWNSANIFDLEGTSTVATIAQDITKRKRTEEELRISDEKYRGIFENILDVYFVTSIDGTINELSPSIEIISKGEYHREDLIGKSMQDLYTFTGGRQTLLALLQEHGRVSDYEIILKNRDSSNMQCSITAKLQFDAHGKPLKIVGSLRDITERKRTENALLESEIKYRAFFENSMDAILLTNPEGNILSVNQAACTMFGYSEDELIKLGRSGIEDATDPRLSVLLAERKLKGKSQGEVTFIRKDGTSFQADISSALFKDQEGNDRTSMIIRDITERKKSERKVIESEKRFKAIFDQAPIGIALLDMQGQLLIANFPLSKMVGYSCEELTKLKFTDFTYSEDIDMDMSQFADLIEGKISSYSMEKRYVHKNGNLVWANLYVTILRDESGISQEIIGMAEDITERKLSEVALQQSEERFRHSFDYAATGICLVGIDGKFKRVNNAFKEMIGYGDDEIKNLTFNDITHPDDLSIGLSLLNKMLLGEIDSASFEKRYMRKDHRVIWTYVSTSLIRDINYKPQFFITQTLDITERKLAEEEIAMLSQSLKSINECVSITDLDDNILFVNESFLKTYGYKNSELIGENISIVRSQANEKMQVDEILPATIGGEWQGEVLNRRKDGSEFTIYLSTTIIKDKESKVLGLIGVATDITERKSTEKELIEAKEKAEESDRLKSAFLANMSHEVRTPLNSIIGFSELLNDPFFEEEDKNEFIQHIISNGKNLLTIISDIMDISKMESGEITIRKSQMNAQKFISGIKEQFAFQIEAKKLELKLTFPGTDEETIVFADVDRLSQIFNNLMSNALKFTANGSIEIGYQPKDNMVEFFVRDTGIGIPAEYHDSIFERFRQVEGAKTRKYGGNGLGLAITKNLVELMGGKIWLKTELGKGSVFYFTLPTYNCKL